MDGADSIQDVDRAVYAYSDTIYRVAYHYLKNREDAEDITHDVLLKWMEKAPPFSSPEHEKAWFIRVTVNACKDCRRQAYRVRRADMAVCPEPRAFTGISLLETVLSLPAAQSTLLYLHYYEGYSIREIAGILRKSERAVQSRLYRARQALKREMEDTDDGYGILSPGD